MAQVFEMMRGARTPAGHGGTSAQGAAPRRVHIPPATLGKLEALFEAPLGRLTFVEGAPGEGIAACASGTTICFDPRELKPGTARGDAMLAHEVAHLFQQAALSGLDDARPVRGVFTVDPVSEHEADLWACLSLCGAACAAALRPRRRRVLPAVAGAIVQPWIMMAKNNADDPEKYGKADGPTALRFGDTYIGEKGPRAAMFTQLTDEFDAFRKVAAAYRYLFNRRPSPAVFDVLHDWLGVVAPRHRSQVAAEALRGNVLRHDAAAAMDARGRAQVRGEMRYYHTYAELAWALHEDVESNGELRDEDDVARIVLTHQAAGAVLCGLGDKVYAFLSQAPVPDEVLGRAPTYAPLHKEATYRALLTALKNCRQHTSTNSSSKLIAMLHDAKDLCNAAKLRQSGDASRALTHVNPAFALDTGAATLVITKPEMRYNVGTPDEADPWVRWMREQHRPVWAGPSFTMREMWAMAKACGASAIEMETMAYMMFAFWNKDYPLTSTPVHRFHGTMAAASEFKVPYLPGVGVWQNFGHFLTRLPRRARL